MKGIHCLLAGCWLAVSVPAAAGPVFWVGNGAPCNFQSLQIAIDAVPDDATLRIASNKVYDDINVDIVNKSLTLEGGYADCVGTPTEEPVELQGSPLLIEPVIRIVSSAAPRFVALNRLRIEGGRRSGVEVSGFVGASLNDVIVDQNEAMTGGGLNIVGISVDDTQVSLARTVIGNLGAPATAGNLASSLGGGIHCRHAQLRLRGAVIRNNRAIGVGGGIYADGCEVNTPLSNFVTTEFGSVSSYIANNVSESFGGGIYAIGASVLNLGPTVHINGIVENSARRGAGVYLRGAGTALFGEGLDIDGNHAEEQGGAGYVGNGASLDLRRSAPVSLANSETPTGVADTVVSGGFPAFRCLPSTTCNSVSLNSAMTVNGSAFAVIQGSLAIAQTEVYGNQSGSGSIFVMGASSVQFDNTLIHGNNSNGSELFRISGGSTLSINSTTMTDNATGSPVILSFSDAGANTASFTNSIIWEPGKTVIAPTMVDIIQSNCMNAHESVSIAALVHDPGFVDAVGGNYRLSGESLNVDACADPFAVATADIVGEIRPVELYPDNGGGSFDRGAYELPDVIFIDGFD